MSDALKIIEGFFDTESSRAVNYMGFGLKLAEALDLARALRDDPYATDEAGKLDYQADLNTLITKLDLLYREFLGNKEQWSKK